MSYSRLGHTNKPDRSCGCCKLAVWAAKWELFQVGLQPIVETSAAEGKGFVQHKIVYETKANAYQQRQSSVDVDLPHFGGNNREWNLENGGSNK